MNICFATLSYPLDGSATSGVGSQAQAIAHSLIDAGHTVSVLNLRLGLESKSWSVTAWAKNLNDEEYNSEWSPGPQFFPSPGYTNNFVFKALPRRWGVDLAYRF